MEDGKARLVAAIEAAQRSAIRRWNRAGHRGDLRIRTNRYMTKILTDLYDAGYRHGQAELARAGYRQYAAPRERRNAALRRLITLLQARLTSVNIRMTVTTTTLSLGEMSNVAIARALARVPGALDAASRVVSTATYSGLGAAFDQASGAVDQQPETVQAGGGGNGWEYTAVMDGATCDPCAEHDGETYPTWDDAQQVLPEGGPNPDCDGDGRCRCRLAPVPL